MNAFANLDEVIENLIVKKEKKPSRPRRKAGRAKWYEDLQNFAAMREGERNTTLTNLALRGRSLELREKFDDEETRSLLIEACTQNGYLQDEGYSATDKQITHMRNIADQKHRDLGQVSTVDRREVDRDIDILHSLVRIPVRIPRLEQWLEAVVRSPSLTPAIKRQLYTAACLQRQHPDWDVLVMSARATAAAAKVNKSYVGKNWREAEKFGFVSFNPGIDYETAKIHGVDPRSSEVSLNLEIFPDLPVENPSINLDDYENQASNFQGYIKYKRSADRAAKHAHLRQEDISTAKPAQHHPLIQDVIAAYLRGEEI